MTVVHRHDQSPSSLFTWLTLSLHWYLRLVQFGWLQREPEGETKWLQIMLSNFWMRTHSVCRSVWSAEQFTQYQHFQEDFSVFRDILHQGKGMPKGHCTDERPALWGTSWNLDTQACPWELWRPGDRKQVVVEYLNSRWIGPFALTELDTLHNIRM